MEDLIQEAARRSARYLKGLEQRRVAPPPEAFKRLGGLADLIERNCRYARRPAEGLKNAGYDVLNEVVLNDEAALCAAKVPRPRLGQALARKIIAEAMAKEYAVKNKATPP